jgi:hypothetical protein
MSEKNYLVLMLEQILQSNIKWDAVVAGIIIIVCLGISIFNLLNNNRKL